jgi:Na+/H+ antiporter NhaB
MHVLYIIREAGIEFFSSYILFILFIALWVFICSLLTWNLFDKFMFFTYKFLSCKERKLKLVAFKDCIQGVLESKLKDWQSL